LPVKAPESEFTPVRRIQLRPRVPAHGDRIPVEEDKSAAECGLYPHPVEHGQPDAMGIGRGSPRSDQEANEEVAGR